MSDDFTSDGRSPGFATQAIHTGRAENQPDAAVDPHEAQLRPARDNPNRALLEDRIASLEGGTAAFASLTGTSAHLLVLHALLDAGDAVLIAPTLLGPADGHLAAAAREFGWRIVTADPEDATAFAEAGGTGPRAILVESLSSTGTIRDLALLAGIAGKAGSPLIVDNTFASPYLIDPIRHGAHLVVHASAATLAGTGEATGGFVVDGGGFDWLGAGTKLARPRPELGDRSIGERYGNFAVVTAIRTSGLGDLHAAMAPLDAFLTLTGLETLSLRVQRQCDSALRIAERLGEHPAVAAVDYAALPGSPALERQRRYCPQGAGPVLTLTLHRPEAVAALRTRLQLFQPDGVAGGTRSSLLAGCPASPERVRLSIGLEDASDLLADLGEALAKFAS